jgi:uncharacterized protein YbjT (DUF2867 family)
MNFNAVKKRTAMSVLVLGGRGFIGRHVVAELVQSGFDVVVGSRFGSDPGEKPRAPSLTQAIRFERMTSMSDWSPVLGGVSVVVNCVGILRPRWREGYEAVHHHAPAALAAACAARDVRLIHISALGLSESARSGFITSKIAGERAIARFGAQAVIVRPSLLDGEGGYGARWLRRVAQWPVHFVPANAQGSIAPLPVEHLAKVVRRLCQSVVFTDRVIEVGGATVLTIERYLAALRTPEKTPAYVFRVPAWLASIVAVVCDIVHATPFSYGHYELLRAHNVPARVRARVWEVGSAVKA